VPNDTESTLKPITSGEFHQFCPHYPTQPWLIGEHEWWRSEAGHLLGVVTFDKFDRDWGCVVLGKDEHGQFRAINVQVSFSDIADARHYLMRCMAT
jgi:hypothetical protein